VRLNDVKPDGSATRVSFGILNLTHRNGSEHPEPLEPGKRYRVRVPLNDAAYSFAAGHRIRISLSTCYWPMVWPSPEAVTLLVYPGTSELELPVRPQEADEHVVGMPQPAAAPAMKKEETMAAPRSSQVVHDIITGRVEVTALRGSGYFRIEDNRIETGRNVSENLSITRGDPLSAVTEVTVDARTGRAGSIIDVKATSRVTADRENFLLESSVSVLENEEGVFSRTWTHKIPRGLL
jgi:hypothetical protein